MAFVPGPLRTMKIPEMPMKVDIAIKTIPINLSLQSLGFKPKA